MLSIIVPTLNEARQIERTLAVLQPFRRAGHELIVVDGGSHDATATTAAPLCHRLLPSAPGRAEQMNVGARVALGDTLWFVHADTLVPEDAVAQIETARAAGHRWGRFDVRLSGRRRALRMVERLMNWRSRLSGIATGDQGIFVERALFWAVGGYPAQPLMEDIALSRRLRRIARPACVLGPLITSSRRWEEHGVWRSIALMWRLRLAYALGADPVALHRRYYRS